MKNHQLHPRLQFTTVREILEWARETHKDKTAYSYREKASDREILKVSFEKLHRDATALASALTSRGVRRGGKAFLPLGIGVLCSSVRRGRADASG